MWSSYSLTDFSSLYSDPYNSPTYFQSHAETSLILLRQKKITLVSGGRGEKASRGHFWVPTEQLQSGL